MKKNLLIGLKIILCLFFTLVVGVGIGIVFTGFEINWQVILYLITAFFVIAGIWLLAFTNSGKKEKIIFAVLLTIFLLLPKFLPFIKHQYDIDSCIDSGICSESIDMKQKNALKINNFSQQSPNSPPDAKKRVSKKQKSRL